MMILHEEHSNLQETEERYDTNGLDRAWDHEPPLLKRGLSMEDVVEHAPCGPAKRELYEDRDWVDIYMMDMDTHQVIGSVDIHGVLAIVAHTI